MTFGILVCGLCGLASAFIGDASPWSMRHAMPSSSYAYVIGFAMVAIIGAAKLSKPPLLRWHAVVALVGIALSLMVHRGVLRDLLTFGPIREHTASSLLYAVGLYGGLVVSLGAFMKSKSSVTS